MLFLASPGFGRGPHTDLVFMTCAQSDPLGGLSSFSNGPTSRIALARISLGFLFGLLISQ